MNSKFPKILSLPLFLFSLVTFAEDERIEDSNIMFLYESRAEIRKPDHDIAKVMSTDYRNARDEFTRYDLFQQIKPVIDKRLSEARKVKTGYLLVGGNLEDYDFNKKGFGTGFSENTYIPFDNGYAVTFINGNDIQFIPVPMEPARSLAGELRKSRRAGFTIHGEIINAKEKKLRYDISKVLEFKINKLEVSLDSGTKVGTMNF